MAKAPAPVETDDFAAAFAQFSGPEEGEQLELPLGDTPDTVVETDDTPETGDTEETGEAPEGVTAEEEPEGADEVAETPEPKAAKPQPAKPQVADDDADDDEAGDDDILDRLAQAVSNRAQRQQPQQPQQPVDEPPLYSADEQKVIDDYMKDFPEVAAAEQLRRRGEYRDIVQFMFQQFAAQMQPIRDTVNVLATNAHLSDIQSRVPNYDELRDNVVEWVGTQPDYLREAYERVISNGTAEQVTDLIRRYEAATGVQAPAPQKEAELPPSAKKAVAALAPVTSKRSAPAPDAVDKSDFDSAFARFAKIG